MVLPEYSVVRHVGSQGGDIFLWIEVRTHKVDYQSAVHPEEFSKEIVQLRSFRMFATGQELGPEPIKRLRFIGTVIKENGGLVWHIYEVL